jgi:hypothetical protein
MAGQIAQSKAMKQTIRFGIWSDNSSAVDLAMYMCGSKRTTNAFLNYCWCSTQDMIDTFWNDIRAIAAALLVETTLSHKRCKEIVRGVDSEYYAELLRRVRRKLIRRRPDQGVRLKTNGTL